jgi:hypothetical protein
MDLLMLIWPVCIFIVHFYGIFNLMHRSNFQNCHPFFLVSPMISVIPGPIPGMDLLMLIWLVCIPPLAWHYT